MFYHAQVDESPLKGFLLKFGVTGVNGLADYLFLRKRIEATS